MTHPRIRTAAVWAHGPRVRNKDLLLNLVEEGVEDRQVQHTCESNATSAALAPNVAVLTIIMGCQLTSTLYTVARAKSGLLSLPDILLRLRDLDFILSVKMELSDSRALAAFSETDLQDKSQQC